MPTKRRKTGCAILDCDHVRGSNQVMCEHHWSMVPMHLRLSLSRDSLADEDWRKMIRIAIDAVINRQKRDAEGF